MSFAQRVRGFAIAAGGIVMLASLNPAPAVATASLPEPQVRACGTGSVFLIGDSVTDPRVGGTGRHTKASFAKLGIRSHTYSRNGLSVRGAVNERYREGFGSRPALAATVWVVALGTNDRPRKGTFVRNVQRVLKHAGNREVWWVTTARPRSYSQGPGGPINRLLRAQAKVHPRMHIIDFAVAVKGKESVYLKRDRVHTNARGSKWLARYYTTPWQPGGCKTSAVD